ncbi:hypothetical protein PRIPAC_86201 [Pristionchus pacificus]|uniref:Uncharacterized protein n=1 Tax=Pristionchus pacificus TaxID=54126 RepID=A0A2A6CEA9_PRIPA|nr:hypothetical protein PRIPAC_86201 [Pristionchus pacificus]|eukprot:PDM76534.1 hypothetical protein PRIPAC_42900 [Pristionchus pacificus]
MTERYPVCLYDIGEEQLAKARETVKNNLEKLEEEGLSRGSSTAAEALARITSTTSLQDALAGAIYAQESTMESVDFKKRIFKDMDAAAAPSTILASSTSTIPASVFTEGLQNRFRCLVVHPVNPPLYLTLTELGPAPWTDASVVDRAYEIMESIGQAPIRLKKEVLGFAVNRLQYALLAESWRLVKDGVLSVEDVDKVMSEGLGPRYAFYGPFGVIHLNAAGVRDYCTRYAGGIRRVLDDAGETPTFDEEEVIGELETSLQRSLPVERMGEHSAERAQKLAELAKLKRKLKKD